VEPPLILEMPSNLAANHMAGCMHTDAFMMMTLLLLAGFVAVGITVMVTLANVLLNPASRETQVLDPQADAHFTQRAA
jgi:hypothetical protein